MYLTKTFGTIAALVLFATVSLSFLFRSSLLRAAPSYSRTQVIMGTKASSSTSEGKSDSSYPIYADESIMSPKAHGTAPAPVQDNLRWRCDVKTADRICCFNRHYAEHSGYWETTKFLEEADPTKEITFFDSVTGKPLFIAPRGRSFEQFVTESRKHGWPSFRDSEVVWENVRCLENGEAVSVDGTHLGHNLPDGKGNRYCINLVSVCGHGSEGGDTAAAT